MSSRLRHSLLLTTLLAFVLGVSGAAAPLSGAAGPIVPSPDPTNTTVAGIDVDATTIPELQKLMSSRFSTLSSVELTNFYLRRIDQLNPILNAVITVSPTAHADAVAADRARRRGDRPAAARDPDHRQGQHQHNGHGRRQPVPGHSRGARPATRSSSGNSRRPARS